MTISQRIAAARKAVVAFLVPNIPVLLLAVQAKWGQAGVGEATAILTAFGVYKATNAK